MVVDGVSKIYRRLRRRGSQSALLTPPTWRVVMQGPLVGLSIFLPGGRNAPWAARICAGEYEVPMLTALADLARSGGVLYDIGAHIGFYGCAWLHLGGERVEAFEPLASTAQILEQTLARNQFTARARVHRLALGDFNGPGQLIANETDLGAASAAYLSTFGPAAIFRSKTPFDHGTAHQVAVRRLDDLVAELALPPPTVLKLDVESAEARVVAGATQLIAAHRPALLCEVHTIAAGLETADRLARLGYTLRLLDPNGVEPACLWLPS